MITKERRDAIFKQFDVENKDTINKEDIKKAFNKMSKNIKDKDVDAIFDEFDHDKNGSIDREEWRAVVDQIIDDSVKDYDDLENELGDE